MPNEIIEVKPNLIPSFDAESLISKAIEQKVPVETMERLLAMRRELKSEFAKEAFDKSLAGFQADCPVIEKTKEVKDKYGKVLYKYAPIESIVTQVKGYLQKHGFSYTIDTKVNGSVTVFCKVTHELGHSEVSELSVPTSVNAIMNEAQKVASALTFAKRYAFCNAFGILTGDEDDDSIATTVTIAPVKVVAPKPLIQTPTPKGQEFITAMKSVKTVAEYQALLVDITEAKRLGQVTEFDHHEMFLLAKSTVDRLTKKNPEPPKSKAAVLMEKGMAQAK